MKFMNTWEIDRAFATLSAEEAPNYARAVTTLFNLMEWTERHSDGWAYWPKPVRAAKQLMELIQGAYGHDNDVTEAEVKIALRPVKSFLTRQGVNHSEVIPS